MEGVISDLLSRFEQGRVSRRELVKGLAMLATAGGGAASAAARQQTPFTVSRIDHISIQVTDLPRSIAFYEEVFGLSILNEDRENEIVRMGTSSILVSLHHKPPTGIVDHYAIAVRVRPGVGDPGARAARADPGPEPGLRVPCSGPGGNTGSDRRVVRANRLRPVRQQVGNGLRVVGS